MPTPLSEEYLRSPKGDRGLYGPCKLFIEYLAEHYHRQYGLDCIGLRFAATFGPGKQAKTHGHQSVLSEMIERSIMGMPTVIPEGGDQLNDFVYVGDIARAFAAACGVDRVEHRIFNIGSGALISLQQAADVIRRLMPESDITVGPGADYLGTGGYGYISLDISRARDELGYVPAFSLDRAVADYVATIRLMRDSVGDAVSGATDFDSKA